MGHRRRIRCHDWTNGCQGYINFDHGHPVAKRGHNVRFAFPCDKCGTLHWPNGKFAINGDGKRTVIGVKVELKLQPPDRWKEKGVKTRRAERRGKHMIRCWFGVGLVTSLVVISLLMGCATTPSEQVVDHRTLTVLRYEAKFEQELIAKAKSAKSIEELIVLWYQARGMKECRKAISRIWDEKSALEVSRAKNYYEARVALSRARHGSVPIQEGLNRLWDFEEEIPR